MHWGYGFPIGGVAAFDADDGVISPGGVGYDINCGCRLMTTMLHATDLRDVMQSLVSELFKNIPTGLGSRGSVRLSKKDQDRVAVEGAAWARVLILRLSANELANVASTSWGHLVREIISLNSRLSIPSTTDKKPMLSVSLKDNSPYSSPRGPAGTVTRYATTS